MSTIERLAAKEADRLNMNANKGLSDMAYQEAYAPGISAEDMYKLELADRANKANADRRARIQANSQYGTAGGRFQGMNLSNDESIVLNPSINTAGHGASSRTVTPKEYSDAQYMAVRNPLTGSYLNLDKNGTDLALIAEGNRNKFSIDDVGTPMYDNLTKEDLLQNGIIGRPTTEEEAIIMDKMQQELSSLKAKRQEADIVAKLIRDGRINPDGLSGSAVDRDAEKEAMWQNYKRMR